MRFTVLLLACALAAPAGATREGATFDLTVAGVPVGTAWLLTQTQGSRYAVEGGADVGFLFWGGQGVATAEGAREADALRPATYRLSYEGVTRPGRVAIDFEGARAVRWNREPPIPPEYAEGRVEVTDAHLDGVLDPLSALVIPAAADVAPEALCARVLPVFSGYTRFDLRLEGAAIGPAGVDCAVRYRAVAGHRPDSASVKRMDRPDAVAISLAPLAPGLWGPSRIAVATRFGTFEAIRR